MILVSLFACQAAVNKHVPPHLPPLRTHPPSDNAGEQNQSCKTRCEKGDATGDTAALPLCLLLKEPLLLLLGVCHKRGGLRGGVYVDTGQHRLEVLGVFLPYVRSVQILHESLP